MTPSRAYQSGMNRDAGHDDMCVSFERATYSRAKDMLAPFCVKPVFEMQVENCYVDFAYVGKTEQSVPVYFAFEMKPIIGQAGALIRQLRYIRRNFVLSGRKCILFVAPVVYSTDKSLAALLHMYVETVMIMDGAQRVFVRLGSEKAAGAMKAFSDNEWQA